MIIPARLDLRSSDGLSRRSEGGSDDAVAFRRREEGFTLIELLLVVVIIGILAAIVVPKLAGRSEDARISAAKGDLNSIRTALSMYEVDNGRYPTQLEGLLVKPGGSPEPKNWRGPYLRDVSEIPKDPWGNPYLYAYPGLRNPTGYDLLSAGPDGAGGTDDDVER